MLLARRDRARLALLLIFPVALFLYLSVQSRFFGRWLLPVYPALALLAGYAFMRGLAWVRERIAALALADRSAPAPRCCCGSRSPPTRARWRCSATPTRARSRASGSPSTRAAACGW